MAHIRRIGNETKIDQILNRDFVFAVRSGYVEVGEDNFCLPVYYEKYEKAIRNFEVFDDDVFITGHPKTGTTWTQEMVWLIVNNLDYEGASKKHILSRSPQLELSALFDIQKIESIVGDYKSTEFLDTKLMMDSVNEISKSKRPRCIKSHLHWSLLPAQIRNGTTLPKIITVMRNPADVCVSLYFHSQRVDGYKGSFEDFCELFLAGRVTFGPFWKQVFSFWNERHRPNVCLIKYHEMKEDLPGVIRKLSDFLGKPLTKAQVAKLADHSSFSSLKSNASFNGRDFPTRMKELEMNVHENEFIRAGKVGGYKSMMSPELIQRFEDWTKENLAGTELTL